MKWKNVNVKDLATFVNESKNKTEVLQGLKKELVGRNYKTLDEKIIENRLDISHFIKKNNRDKIDEILSKEKLEEAIKTCYSYKGICNYLKINYTCYNKKVQEKLKEYGLRVDITRQEGNWEKWENDYLIENYATKEKNEILETLKSRSWDAIKIRAEKFKIKRRTFGAKRTIFGCRPKVIKTGHIEVLLKEDPIPYYWMGFLMADGHFVNNSFTCTLSIKDKNHLVSLANFLNVPFSKKSSIINEKEFEYIGFFYTDSIAVPKIIKKFDISHRKTHEPCDISRIKNRDLFVAWAIGFIDGDGCIKKNINREDSNIFIKCHSSWLFNLQLMSDRICGFIGLKPNRAILNKKGYAKVCFSNSQIVQFLKKEGYRMHLPLMTRKWDRINMSFISRRVIAQKNKEKVMKLNKSGLSIDNIALQCGLSYGGVYRILRKEGINIK